MESLISFSYHMKSVLLISSFIAPVLFLLMKNYKIGIGSLVAVSFSFIMLNTAQEIISLAESETRVFLFMTQILNIFAASLMIMKLRKKTEERVVIEDNQGEMEEVKELGDLLKEKGILNREEIGQVEEKTKEVI